MIKTSAKYSWFERAKIFRMGDFPHVREPWNPSPNNTVEPYFGLVDSNAKHKEGLERKLTWKQVGKIRVPWIVSQKVSAFHAYKDAIAGARGERDRSPPPEARDCDAQQKHPWRVREAFRSLYRRGR